MTNPLDARPLVAYDPVRGRKPYGVYLDVEGIYHGAYPAAPNIVDAGGTPRWEIQRLNPPPLFHSLVPLDELPDPGPESLVLTEGGHFANPPRPRYGPFGLEVSVVTPSGASLTARLDERTARVRLYQDGHWAGDGYWTGTAIADASARLGAPGGSETDWAYDALDDALRAAQESRRENPRRRGGPQIVGGKIRRPDEEAQCRGCGYPLYVGDSCRWIEQDGDVVSGPYCSTTCAEAGLRDENPCRGCAPTAWNPGSGGGRSRVSADLGGLLTMTELGYPDARPGAYPIAQNPAACPWTGTVQPLTLGPRGECAHYRERAVAGTGARPPGCPVHGPWREGEAVAWRAETPNPLTHAPDSRYVVVGPGERAVGQYPDLESAERAAATLNRLRPGQHYYVREPYDEDFYAQNPGYVDFYSRFADPRSHAGERVVPYSIAFNPGNPGSIPANVDGYLFVLSRELTRYDKIASARERKHGGRENVYRLGHLFGAADRVREQVGHLGESGSDAALAQLDAALRAAFDPALPPVKFVLGEIAKKKAPRYRLDPKPRKKNHSYGSVYGFDPGPRKKGARKKDVFDLIVPGATVTILVPSGTGRRGTEWKPRNGRAVMRGPSGWVLDMGGRHGTPGIATRENTVAVKGKGVADPYRGNPARFGRYRVQLQDGFGKWHTTSSHGKARVAEDTAFSLWEGGAEGVRVLDAQTKRVVWRQAVKGRARNANSKRAPGAKGRARAASTQKARKKAREEWERVHARGCPRCGVERGELCVSPSGRTVYPHPERRASPRGARRR